MNNTTRTVLEALAFIISIVIVVGIIIILSPEGGLQ
jgi:hypothetical protein